MNSSRIKRALGTASILLLLLVLAAGSAPIAQAAATITVNTLIDEDIANSACSFREATIAANMNADYNGCSHAGTFGNDTITFAVTGTITLTSGLYSIDAIEALTITGPAGGITISGAGLYPILNQQAYASLTLQNLTFANAHSPDSGAAIFASGATAPLIISGSTFIDNSSSGNGGAIYDFNAPLYIANSTFVGNSAVNGGAIYNASGKTIYLSNTTFSGNSASTSGGALYQAGAGSLDLRNTIIANSTSGGNCGGSGTIQHDTYSLQYPDQACGIGIAVGDPKLGPLTNNGGPTQTMALLTGSAATGAGHNSACTAAVGSPSYGAGSVDQRGMLRPQPQEIGAYCDIGAYERGPATAISAAGGATQSTQINSAFPTPLQVEVTDILGGRLDAVNVTFAGPSTGAGIASGGTVATNSNGIATFSATANSAAGGPYTVTATAGALSAPFSLTNNPYSTTTTITGHLLNPSHAGQSVTVTFAVTSPGGTPAGSVTVSDATSTCTGTIAAGSCAIILPTPGTHTLTATYNGNSSFAGSTSTAVSHTVTGWILYLPLTIR